MTRTGRNRRRRKRAALAHPVNVPGLGQFYSEIADEPTRWVIPGLVPCDYLTLLMGDPGTAKSLLTQTWAGQLSQCGLSTLLVAAEDSPASVIAPRLSAMGADRTKVCSPVWPPRLPGDMPKLADLVTAIRPRLMVLDLLPSFSSLPLNHGDNAHRVLQPLLDLAKTHQLGIVGVVHTRKNGGKVDIYRPLGSIELGGMARSVLLLEQAKSTHRGNEEDEDYEDYHEDEDRSGFILRQVKLNLGRPQEPRRFYIASIAVDVKASNANGVGKKVSAPVIIWCEDEK